MYFESPYRIFPAGKPSRLVLAPCFPVAVDPAVGYELELHPFSGLRRYGLRDHSHAPTAEDAAFFAARHPLTAAGNTLEITLTLPQEDCYICRLFAEGGEIEKFEIYALEEDLFGRTPYKGDNHLHTYMSDGKDSPMYMAAAACRLGYDYCVITDHGQYGPSLMARDFYADTGVDFLVIPGEEVHSPGNPIHIINLGGSESVNDWFRQDEAAYRAAVAAEMEQVDDAMLDGDRFSAAACQVMFDRIRAVDGIAVLCHPHWIIANGYNEHEDVTEYLAEHKRFDALELIAGGAYEDGTQLQLSYFKTRESMPILGSSDSHGCFGDQLEPGNYTIVFADALDAASVKDAIRAGFTVAGNANKLYGPYRLVKYAYFLLRNYYPAHDASRNALGAKMLRMASSRADADSDMGRALASPRPSENFASWRFTE